MAAFFTIAQLRERLRGLASQNHNVVDLLNEVGERAYAIGRWPDSTVEIRIPAADLYKNTDSGGEYENEWFCRYDGELYDAAIGFRANGFGYEVGDRSELYRELPSGQQKFIDVGLEDDTDGTSNRVFKCPSGIGNTDNVRAWVKKRWVDLRQDADEFPIRSFAAVKAGFQAASYEADNNIEAARAKWQTFESLLLGDERQFHGPKRPRAQLKMRYRRSPNSFL